MPIKLKRLDSETLPVEVEHGDEKLVFAVSRARLTPKFQRELKSFRRSLLAQDAADDPEADDGEEQAVSLADVESTAKMLARVIVTCKVGEGKPEPVTEDDLLELPWELFGNIAAGIGGALNPNTPAGANE